MVATCHRAGLLAARVLAVRPQRAGHVQPVGRRLAGETDRVIANRPLVANPRMRAAALQFP